MNSQDPFEIALWIILALVVTILVLVVAYIF